jgi:hypothetical protein
MFGRCEILTTFQWSGPNHWNVGLRRTYAQNGLYITFKVWCLDFCLNYYCFNCLHEMENIEKDVWELS